MKYTSSEAAKLLRKLNEEITYLELLESRSREFKAALGEDIESVRPPYNYKEVKEKLEALQEKVRIVKHTINKFNVTTEVPGFAMTIDQMLIYIPQLRMTKMKLAEMSNRLPKERERIAGNGSAVIDYRYANYDIETVKADCQEVSDELARAQTALDLVNSTVTMDIDME